MDNKIKQILNSYKSSQSVNLNTYFGVQFNASERLLPPDEMNRVLDIGAQFNLERQSSPYYRISGKINPLISNVLFNTIGNKDCWEMLSQPAFIKTSLDSDKDLSYAESIKKNLKEKDGWYGYFNPVLIAGSSCEYIDMEPKRERFSFIPDITNIINQQVKNWEISITYPYTADTTHNLINNGLLITNAEPALAGGKTISGLFVPVHHNLINTDKIILTGTNKDGEYDIIRIGKDNGDLKEYIFCIDINPTTLILGANSRMIKLYNSVPSQYYFRKFKKVNTRSSIELSAYNYDVTKLAFSETIYTDDVMQFVFNEDISINELTDNLGRPLSELYLTIIKTDSNKIFSNISSGIEAPIGNPILNNYLTYPYYLGIPIIQKIHNITASTNIPQSYTPLENNVLITNNDFYGDIVEYNKTTVQEVVLSDIYHRFNTINRETFSNALVSGPRPEGYYYKAHFLIKIKDFSSYIEEGDQYTYGMPDYKVNLNDNRFIWRDLMDIGSTDINKGTLNYPFANGCHYLYNNYCFDVKRQDPFDNWDLYHSRFPNDSIGNALNNNFKVNSTDNVC